MTQTAQPQTDEKVILLDDLGDGVFKITFNRPAKRNAMNRAARTGIVEALDQVRGKAKVVIMTGSGPAFCSGIDLKEELAAPPGYVPPDTIEERRSIWKGVQEEIRTHPAVIIAAVNGTALGGGVTLVNTSDLAITAEEAEFGMPEAGFGVYPGLAGPSTQLRTSLKRAAWMVLTAERISGRTAVEWGLVNKAVPLEDLQVEAEALAKKIARYDAATLEWCKKALWQVPMNITNYTAALEYGFAVNAEIRSQNKIDKVAVPDSVAKK
jgi:enoyl-CoA hydratase/carnithine racemase